MTRLSNLWATGTTRARELASGPIARASGLSLGIRVTGLLLSFAQAILTARLLGPAGYGTVATILSTVQILATIAAFGLGPLAIREIPTRLVGGEKPALASMLCLSAKIVLLLSSALAAIAVFLVLPIIGRSSPGAESFAAGGLLIIPLAFLTMLGGWSRGFGRIAIAQVPAEVLRPCIMVVALGFTFVLYKQIEVSDFLITALLAAIAAVTLSLAFLWRSELRMLPPPIGGQHSRELTTNAWPFLGLALTAILQSELLTLLLAAMAGPYETGLFQPVARLTPLMLLPVQAAGMRYAPRMAEFWRTGEHERIRSVTQVFTLSTTLLTLLLGLGVAGCGRWLMFAFGKEFGPSAPLLWIAAAAQLFNAACGPAGMLMVMTGHSRSALGGQILGVILTGILGAVLVPSYGALGAVIAMALGICVWNSVMLILVITKLGFNPSLSAYIWRWK